MPIYGLTKANKMDEIIKMLNLDLRSINAYIVKLIQAKVIGSLPIALIQRFRVGKKITNPDKNLIGPLIFLVNVFIFDAKAKVPIFPIKENKNVIEKIFKWKYCLKNFVIKKINPVPEKYFIFSK